MADQPLIAGLVFFLWSVFAFFATAPLAGVLFLSLAFHYAGNVDEPLSRSYPRILLWARGIAVIAFLSFCLASYTSIEVESDDASHYLSLGLRAFLVFIAIEGGSRVALVIVALLWAAICRPFAWLRTRLAARKQRRAEAALLRRNKRPLPRPLHRPLSLREQIDQLKQEFQATSDSLRSAGLDSDELESALESARQRYVRQLSEVMKH